ncbi:serine acetyltransferase [bacterium]|nr:serine acetyltransferase [bacterium]
MDERREMDRSQPVPPVSERVHAVAEALSEPLSWQLLPDGKTVREAQLPSRRRVIDCVEELRGVLFPGYFGYREFGRQTITHHVGAALERVSQVLALEIAHATGYTAGQDYGRDYADPRDVARIVDEFIAQLPRIRRLLTLDCRACYEWDPAAFIPEAPIFCYPNMLAMMNFRLAHELYIRRVPFIPRIITEHAHNITGIDIHPGATIGESFFIDHGTGVVIGQTAIVGDRVRLYQGVTLGAIRFPLDQQTERPIKGQPRHPIIEDDVVIFAESTVLGRITVGQGSIIGANVFLAKSVPPQSKVFAPPVRVGQLSKRERDESVAGG